MQGFLMQDWTTLRLNFGQNTLVQTEANWLDLAAYQDAVVWLDLREASLATGHTSLQFAYETAPTRDDGIFRAAASSPTFTATLPATLPDVQKIVMANAIPLARFLRWKLIAAGTGSAGVSDVTFRLTVAANMVGGR